MTDKELMKSVRDGDFDKLSVIFDRYNAKLYGFFMKLTVQPQVSEDLVQEVFFRMLKYRHTYKGSGLFTTWMFQIAHNCFYDYLKKNKENPKNKPIEKEAVEIRDDSDVYNAVTDNEEAKILRKALMKLDDIEREVLILSRYQNMKYKEISKLLNCAVGTIKSKVHFALRKLKNHYIELSGEEVL